MLVLPLTLCVNRYLMAYCGKMNPGCILMASPSWSVVFCLVSLATPAFASNEIYRYTDDSGTLNFTTELHQIPRNTAIKPSP